MMNGTQELLQNWTGLGVVQAFDQETGTWFFIALHDASRGTMVGGAAAG